MTVTELLSDLSAKFPRGKDWIHAWSSVFRKMLGDREGRDLRHAYDVTLGLWAEPGCPKPAQIALNLPARPQGQRENVAMPWEARDAERNRLAAALERTWTRELQTWFETAQAEGWLAHLRLHVANLARWCAQCEQNGRGVNEAITSYNAAEYRGDKPRRAPEILVDETDAAIFRARIETHQRVKLGRHPGGVHSWTGAWRRDRLRNRILDQVSPR